VARRSELEAQYRENFANPFKAAELGYIDEVIRPEETRPKVIQALEMLATKRDWSAADARMILAALLRGSAQLNYT